MASTAAIRTRHGGWQGAGHDGIDGDLLDRRFAEPRNDLADDVVARQIGARSISSTAARVGGMIGRPSVQPRL